MSNPAEVYILSELEREELLAPIQNHNHCWGALAEQILGDAVRERTQNWCAKSRAHEHEWVYPRMEDSIDRQRNEVRTYCRFCFTNKGGPYVGK